jgi:hypothetical protein
MRRLKNYAAQSGYVYQYFYQGQQPTSRGVQYRFEATAEGKKWFPISVLLSAAAVRFFEQTHGRALSATECYAVAKVALFQAFDERPNPSGMKEEIHVREADIEGFLEKLGLE